MKVGDIVKFLNEEGEGTVVKIINKKRVVIDFGQGMEIPVFTDDLILISTVEPTHEEEEKVEEKSIQEEPIDLTVLKNLDFSTKKKSGSKKMDIHAFAKSLTPLEVDLHIEKLTDNHRGLSNSEIMVIQLSHFESYLDQGLQGQYKTIVFIHGIGTGVLKNEIRKQLKAYRQVRFTDADVRKFGYGATEVHFI